MIRGVPEEEDASATHTEQRLSEFSGKQTFLQRHFT